MANRALRTAGAILRQSFAFVFGFLLIAMVGSAVSLRWPATAEVGAYGPFTPSRTFAVCGIALGGGVLGAFVAWIVGKRSVLVPAGGAAALWLYFGGSGVLSDWRRSEELDLVWFTVGLVFPISFLLAALVANREFVRRRHRDDAYTTQDSLDIR